jgi:hypothetical protein
MRHLSYRWPPEGQCSQGPEGDPLAVVSRRGRAVAPARISPDIRADTIFMPFHWPGPGRANTVTNPALDPTSRMPGFKVCAVRVELDVAPGAIAPTGRGKITRFQTSRPPRPDSAEVKVSGTRTRQVRAPHSGQHYGARQLTVRCSPVLAGGTVLVR